MAMVTSRPTTGSAQVQPIATPPARYITWDILRRDKRHANPPAAFIGGGNSHIPRSYLRVKWAVRV